jgi:hypothetical protein
MPQRDDMKDDVQDDAPSSTIQRDNAKNEGMKGR